MTDTRVCGTCGEEKPITAFRLMHGSRTNNGKPYRFRHCNPCVNAAAAKTRAPIPALPTEAEMRDWYQKGCRI